MGEVRIKLGGERVLKGVEHIKGNNMHKGGGLLPFNNNTAIRGYNNP